MWNALFFRKLGIFGPNATSELNRFVVYLALPALLFDIIAHARWSDVGQPGFIMAFGLGAVLVFAVTLIFQISRSRHLADAALDALNSSYANTGFMGFPLALAFLGPTAMAPTLIATIITVCVLFAFAIVIVETGIQTERRRAQLVAKVVGALVRNPLLYRRSVGCAADGNRAFHVGGVLPPGSAHYFANRTVFHHYLDSDDNALSFLDSSGSLTGEGIYQRSAY
ncbi:AEC family transporter [Dickeya fangzhongdai]